MDSTLKDYMDQQQTERIAHIVVKNFEQLINRKLTEDEVDFALMVSEASFEKSQKENYPIYLNNSPTTYLL